MRQAGELQQLQRQQQEEEAEEADEACDVRRRQSDRRYVWLLRSVRSLAPIRWFARRLRQREAKRQLPPEPDSEQLLGLLPWMVPRARPRPLAELSRSSGLSVGQLRRMYSQFKQECPNGLMRRESFQEICGFFFPLGEASLYASLLFDSFLASGCQEERLCFEQLVETMSRLSSGGHREKSRWLFRLYDADKDGRISQHDLLLLVTGVYNLCGFTNCRPPVVPQRTAESVSGQLFAAMDSDGDGFVSWEEFEAFLEQKLDSQRCPESGVRTFWTAMDPLSDL